MEYLHNEESETENSQIRPQLRWIDLTIWFVAAAIMLAVVWHKTRPEPVLPTPGQAVLAHFCQP